MKIEHALREYLLDIEVRKYTPKTIRSYRNNLNLFVRYLDEEADIFDTEDLTLAAVRKFSAYMVGRGKKGRYVNGLLKTAKSFIQYCYDEGYGGFNTKNGCAPIRFVFATTLYSGGCGSPLLTLIWWRLSCSSFHFILFAFCS